MSVPSPDVGPASATADYEALRRAVLDGVRAERDLGLVLLMRRGMGAWTRAWSASAAATAATDRVTRRPVTMLPAGLRGEVTRVLVSMALTAAHMEAHP
jgi:hypothetical protein